MPTGAECSKQFSVLGAETLYDIGCSEGNGIKEKIEKYSSNNGKSFMKKAIESTVACLFRFFRRKTKELKDELKIAEEAGDTNKMKLLEEELDYHKRHFGELLETLTSAIYGSDIVKCKNAFMNPPVDCPPNPNVGGGTSIPMPPADPNDIYGFLSESGSKFMADTVARVNYIIEFENDTTQAMAAAHKIVVKDTLDSRYFDLEKFIPTGVRIGSKEEHLSESDIYTNNGRTSFVKTIDIKAL